MTRQAASVGIAAHSGWAAVVALGRALGRAPDLPAVLARTRFELIDTDFPESKQPYHAVEALPLAEAERRVDRYRAKAQSMAHAALLALAQDLEGLGFALRSVGILESSGRKGSPLCDILASHALIHCADGDHFRNALAAAAERLELAVTRVPARDLDSAAEAGLRRPVNQLTSAVAQMGRQVGAPWGADQKKAALLAWLLLQR